MANLNEDFARRVDAALGAMSLRGAMLKTGIDHATIGKMRMGFVPRSETVIRFARGFGLDVNEWLEFAGYEPIGQERSGSDVLLAGIDALQRELDRPLRISFHGQIRAGLSVEEAEQTLAVIQQQARDGLFDD